MPTITLTDPTTGTTVATGLMATNFANLRSLLNSGLDYVNLKGNPQLVAGEVPVWNGTQFDRSSVTRIGPGSLGSGSPSATNFLRGDGSWQIIAGPTAILRKTTQKNVGGSIAATDLLNAEITIPALTSTSIVRFRGWGLMVNNSAAVQSLPSFNFVLGGTAFMGINGNGMGAIWSPGAGSTGWMIDMIFNNQGATNVQVGNMEFKSTIAGGNSAATNSAGGWLYSPVALGGVSTVYGQATASTAVDTTSARTLTLTVTNAVNHALYATALNGAIIEVY